jgi:multidrug resistance efflux pump
MSSRIPPRLLCTFLTIALLGGCAADDSPLATPAHTADPAWIAIARGRIDIEGGLLRLAMPREGVISEVMAHEGDKVRKGQLLAALDSEPARLVVGAAEAEQKQAGAQIASLQARIKAAEQRSKRLAAAAAAGAGDQQSADDARESAEQLRGELSSAQAAGALAAQKLASARYELGQRSLHAPLDAEVIRRSIQVGASVSPQSGPAFILLPEQARIVRAELNDSFVNAVHVGMSAEVVEDGGSNGARFTARVLRIGSVFGASTLEEDPLLRASARTIECVLELDASAPSSLLIGQRVLVRFPAGSPARTP